MNMANETVNPNLLKLILDQPEAYKFLTGMFAVFVLPPIINIVNTVVKNKSIKSFNEKIDNNLTRLNTDVRIVKDRIDQMYMDTFDECNPSQIEAVYRGRVSIDVDLLVRNTKQIIIINHIADKDTTRKKVINYCRTVFGNTRIVMNHFKRNGVSCGAMINEHDYLDIISNTIIAFVYSKESLDGCDKQSYNYEILKLNLKSLYDTFTVEFINKINSETSV